MDFPVSASEQAAAGEALPVNRRELLVRDLEVVTVTEQSAIITWFTGSADETDRYGRPAPVPTDTELLLGQPGEPDTLATALHEHRRTPYHHAEVGGLEPGRTYAFEARSDGVPARKRGRIRVSSTPRTRSPSPPSSRGGCRSSGSPRSLPRHSRVQTAHRRTLSKSSSQPTGTRADRQKRH